MTAASGADQPTLRDQLAEALRQAGVPGVLLRDRAANALLPLIAAREERAKADAQAALQRVRDLADAIERDAPKPQVGGFIAEAIRNALDGDT